MLMMLMISMMIYILEICAMVVWCVVGSYVMVIYSLREARTYFSRATARVVLMIFIVWIICIVMKYTATAPYIFTD